jgi:hypothetical protein
MISNRLPSYLHPYRRRSSFPNMGGRGNHVVLWDDGPTVNESTWMPELEGLKEGRVPGLKALLLSHQSRKRGSLLSHISFITLVEIMVVRKYLSWQFINQMTL